MGKLIDITGLQEFKSKMVDMLFPIGSVFTTTDSSETTTTLHNRFGGTWESLGENLVIINNDLEVKTKNTSHNTNGRALTWKDISNNTNYNGSRIGNVQGTNYLAIEQYAPGTLEPNNLYAIKNGISIYAWKRTA